MGPLITNAAVSSGGGAPVATEATLLSVFNAIVASDQDIEILLVRDTGDSDKVLQQITNYETGTPVVTYKDVNGNVVVPVGPLEYLDPSAVLNLVLAAIQAQGLVPQATEATLLALSAKFNSLGQKASALSAPVVLSTEQEAILATIDSVLDSIKVDTGNAATEVTLLATNALLTTIDTVLDNILVDTTAIATNIGTLATPITGLATSLLIVSVTGAASVSAGKRSVSFMNTGNNDATVNGSTLKAGLSIDYPLLSNRDVYAAIPYNALTSELTITTVG